jgi:hypothetical protein
MPPITPAIGNSAESSADQVHFKTDLACTLASQMERLGVATMLEVDAETLADRVFREVAACNGVVVGRSEIGAWSRA